MSPRLARTVALGALLAGCASTSPTKARQDVADVLTARVGTADPLADHTDAEGQARVRDRVQARLRQPLTVDAALEIAMINNRGLQATLEELGVAQADLVEAGLLDNPVVGGDLVVSSRGFGYGGGLSLSQSLLSAFLIPAKRRVAKARLQYAIVTVTGQALALARDVKIAYAHVVTAQANQRLQRTLVQAAEVGDEISRRQREAGNITELDRELFAAALDEARLELAEHDLHVVEAREELNRLLGLWGDDLSWTLAEDGLDAPPKTLGDLEGLERRGIDARMDVSAARFEVESIELAIALRRRGVVPEIEVGAEARNEVGSDVGHEWVLGPALSIELPIFNPGHADFARLRATLRQAQHRLQQTAIEARSEIRVRRQQLVTAQQQARYLADEVLPRRATIGARALERYNAMLIGAYELLQLRAEQVQAQHEHVEAVRDYWVAHAELEMAIGGRVSG